MKAVLPWLLVVALAGGLVFVFQQAQRKEAAIAELLQQSAEVTNLKAEIEELRHSTVSKEEVARLRKENAEIYQLRNKVSQLQHESSTRTTHSPALGTGAIDEAFQKNGSLTADQIQLLIRENQQLRSEAQEYQVMMQREAMNKCINNLRQLDGATEQWAIENKKTTGDLVSANDVTPYLKKFPECPAGGAYTIGPVGTPPTCSSPGHALPP